MEGLILIQLNDSSFSISRKANPAWMGAEMACVRNCNGMVVMIRGHAATVSGVTPGSAMAR
jgi:hypothetical protein